VNPDPTLDALLGLDGQIFVINAETGHWVQFVVRPVPATTAKPHGLDYSLTLHAASGERLVGFDNAHSVRSGAGPGGKSGPAMDHRHRLRTVRPYDYRDAASLLQDFWAEVDTLLRELGVLP